VTADCVAQTEAHAAEQNQAEKDGEQHAGAQREFRITTGVVLLWLFDVKDSAHRPSLAHFI
jgi:hypothetical protein